MKYAIDIENLSFGYQSDSIELEGINWKVEQGQSVALVGPNGGGKTTLLKVILGLCQPRTGTVKVLGVSPEKALKYIAYVPQNMAFDKQFPITALDVVLMGRLSHLPWYGRYSQHDKELALESLRTVGLEDKASAAFGELSGGQRQRVLIARALVSHPQLLLLDEPTASVDMEAEKEIYAILNKLQGKMTIIMVTHDLQIAMDNVNNVAVVQRTLRSLSKEEVCQHFAIGLYHPPQGKLHVIS